MQCASISLRKTEDISEIVSEIAFFWEKFSETAGSENSYRPVWQEAEWAKMLVGSGQAEDAVFFGAYGDSGLEWYGIGEIRSVGSGIHAMFFVGGPQWIPGIHGKNRCTVHGLPGWLPGVSGARSRSDVPDCLAWEIRTYAKSRGFAFVLFESLAEMTPDRSIPYSWQTKYLLEPVTRLLDLGQSNEELLADMKQKGRYNIRLAEKNGCEVRRVSPTPENIDIFYGLLRETTDRDGFSANGKAYYERLLQCRNHPSEGLYVAYWQGRAIAASVLTVSGNTATYYYGASSSDPDIRRLMAPYLLQWEMIRSAKMAGCQWYDFLGTAPEGEPSHHLRWVTDFKSKFWGIVREWPEKRILVTVAWKFLAYRAMRYVKNFLKGPR